MSRTLILENPEPKTWSSLMESAFPEGNFLQSFEYGEMARVAYPGTKTVRLLANYDDKTLGFAQGTYRTYSGFGTTLDVRWGPLISKDVTADSNVLGDLINAFEVYCKKHRIIELSFSPLASWGMEKAFLDHGYLLKKKENEYVVNLEGGSEKLWASIHHNKRRNIKTAMEQGVEVTQSHSAEDLKTFYSLLDITVQREGFTPFPRALFNAIWNDYNPELSLVFIAKWKEKSISSVYVMVHGKTAYALNAGSLVDGREVRPNDIMHWKAMEWACSKGYLKYNLGGVSEPPPTEGSSKWGIWRWKKEWRGNLDGITVFNKVVIPRYKIALRARDLVYKSMEHFK